MTRQFASPLVGEHREQSRRRPQVGRPPDCLRHAELDLKWGRKVQSGDGPRPGGAVGRHLAKTKWPPSEQNNSSDMVLPEDFSQGNSSSSETP
jgi:hypothetical protein